MPLGKRRSKCRRGKRGAPRKYEADLIKVLKTCWLAMEQPWWKAHEGNASLCSEHLDCPEEIRALLGKISAASIDRLLQDFRVIAGKKVRLPKPANAVKAFVELRAQSWDITEIAWSKVPFTKKSSTSST